VPKETSTRRILFVDDEEGIRATLPRILQKRGFAVTAVGNIAAALTEVSRTKYDVLVSDLNIEKPGDGFIVIAAMQLFRPKCLNFVLTAYPALETAVQGIRHGIAEYFTKPVEIEDLVDAINEKLKGRGKRRIKN
jgi:DNA-binding NtrC family response regulator